jgi:hypothetical protein
MARRQFRASWVRVWNDAGTHITTGSPIQAGGSGGRNSLIGIPSDVRKAMQDSKTTPRIFIRFRAITSGRQFSLGGHRWSSLPPTSGLPWYKWLGRSFSPSSGWVEYDISSQFRSEYMSGNLEGIVLYNGPSVARAEAYGATNNSNHFTFIVEGTWNEPPTTPGSFTSPTGGQVVSESVTASWGASTDSTYSSNQLRYEVQIDNAGSWQTVIITSPGVTSATINTSSIPETSTARLRVRAIDPEGLTSSWRTSPNFTIQHNQPPSQPTNLSPANNEILNVESEIEFSWDHNDRGQPQAGYRLSWRVRGSSTWNYIPSASSFVSTSSESVTIEAGTMPEDTIEWRVMTQDQYGEVSPWSTVASFKLVSKAAAPDILAPQANEKLNSPDLFVNWSVSGTQTDFQFELRHQETFQLLHEEEERSSRRSFYPDYKLEDGSSYALRVRVKTHENPFWSDWSSVEFSAEFTPPQQPTIQVLDHEGEVDYIEISWNATYDASYPTSTIRVELQRRLQINGEEWLTVHQTTALTGRYTDHTPASGMTYEYRMIAVGDNGSTSESEVVLGVVEFDWNVLQPANNLSDKTFLEIVSQRQTNLGVDMELFLFDGRKRPVVEFGEIDEYEVAMTIVIDRYPELMQFQAKVQLRSVFLYRDANGRRYWVVANNVQVSDRPVHGFEVSFVLKEVDYKEGI